MPSNLDSESLAKGDHAEPAFSPAALRVRFAGLMLAVAGVWFLPALLDLASVGSEAWRELPHGRAMIQFALLAGLGVLMAAWTIGGPGFVLLRVATACAVGVALAWWNPTFPKSTMDGMSSFSQVDVGVLGSWVGISYVASLLPVPAKVVVPRVAPRMEERCQCAALRIESRQIARFFEIAIDASQGQVCELVAALVLARDDVLDLEGNQRRILLPALAILAAISSPRSHGGSRGGVHC